MSCHKYILILRNQAIIELLYGTGMRVSELCSLNFENLNLSERFLKVMGKGGVERVIPFGKHFVKYYNKYKLGADVGWGTPAFLSKSGRRLSRSDIWKLVQKFALESGVKKRIYPHAFRHTFATHMLENGAPLVVIKDMLGHESINDTEKYLHLSNKYVQQRFRECHPRF